ncbi:FAD-dependent oxidoreductase [Nocardioides sp. CER19]|uniref:FAD-dependent oxidoreductase n=1 Tax=Nocardioides sp. CER19 TaxID=3038538 RepID=UPI00244C3B43|nr:FAD-dependent oxidoreductase [Nocardioides sp. CER19]MDH2415523.1 FAD-dependent oxidoreductase [Nocardioides sp. CER19]
MTGRSRRRAIVVGAGAWGLPTAAQLALRGHEVTLVDRYGVANLLSSSPGPTRVWRHADATPVLCRLGLRSVGAMDRLAARSGTEVYRKVGVLWRDHDPTRLLTTLREEEVEHVEVEAADVGRWLPGLVPDERPAVWTPLGGCVLAAASMAAQGRLFREAGGRLVRDEVIGIDAAAGSVELRDGGRMAADVVVVAPGPGAVALLPMLDVDVPLTPQLEQVVHFGSPDAPHRYDDVPCLFEGAYGASPGFYSMPTPGRGYKIGLDVAVRGWTPDDVDRTPSDERTHETAVEAARLGFISDPVLDAQICSWTDSPDGLFVIDRVGRVVLACGDSGAGFKFSALMGEILADLAEEGEPDADVGSLGLARFDGRPLVDRRSGHLL